MSEALQKLRASNRRDFTLHSGIVVTAERVMDLYDAIVTAEDIPVPVLDHLESEDEEHAEEAARKRDAATRALILREGRKRQDDAIRLGVVAIDGEPTTIPPDVPLASLFSTEERKAIGDYCVWVDNEGKG